MNAVVTDFRTRSTRNMWRFAALSVIVASSISSNSYAILHSFQPSDGYNISGAGPFPADWIDVSYFNAGQYGVNAGNGPGPTLLAPDSGLWSLTSQVGGFFTSAAARTASVGTAPPYPNIIPSGTVPAYLVGNHFPGRGGDGSNLAFRNDTPLGTGAASYDYSLDTYDFGGPVPSSITSGNVETEFYFCPNPGDVVNPGTPRQDKFTMSFKDSGNNIGVQWGYARDNEVTWRTNPSGSWTYTGIFADAANWDGLNVDINLTNDTFSMDYYDISTSTWLPLAAAGTPLGTAMTDLTVLGWQLEDGLNSGIGGKNFFDDFSFHTNVPEPSSLVLGGLALGVCAWIARRRHA